MTSTKVRPRTDRRAERYAARRVLWRESSLKRVRSCGHHAVAEGGVAVKAQGSGATRSAGFAGLASCGSVWACPWCSAKVSAHRQAELRTALHTWQSDPGRSVVMVTLTMRHRDGQALRHLWDANAYAWGKVTSGRGWQTDQHSLAIAGWVRVVEVTHGQNGWHVHVHALMFLDDGDQQDWEVDFVGQQMFTRWRAALVRKGFAAPLANSGGLDVKRIGGDAAPLADYFTKTVYSADDSADRAALEVARGDLKSGRSGNRSPFQILRDVVAIGDADDLDTWHEWEAGSRGRRQMTWSRGFRDQVLAEPERTDEDIADEDHGGDVLVVLDGPTWSLWRDHGVQLLRAAEADDTGDALALLLRAGPDGGS